VNFTSDIAVLNFFSSDSTTIFSPLCERYIGTGISYMFKILCKISKKQQNYLHSSIGLN